MKNSMGRTKIKTLLNSEKPLSNILIKGWIRTRRDSKSFSFLEVNDGSSLSNIQIIADQNLQNYDEIKRLTTGSSVSILGSLVPSKGKGQKWEIKAINIDIIHLAPEDYPLQKKRHSDEFLRKIAHLRPRTNKYGACFRIRSDIAYAIHKFFRENGFFYIHTPILTGSDCEGAGEMFRVTTLAPGSKKFENDFFGKESKLSVSGQLEAELLALSLGDVYTFGPTFRAENSNTRRHAAEFWMVEPEMAFCNLQSNMDLSERLIKFLINFSLSECYQDLQLFCRFVDKELKERLVSIVSSDFARIPYSEAISILNFSNNKFNFPASYGCDLQTEHERFLTEKHFKKPVIVFDYPKEIKPFYMRLNDDNKTVAAMDVLVPKIGELIGGSQREDRYDFLKNRMLEDGLSINDYWWYLESRKYGSVPHSGFGLGFERLIMLITSISNIRDVIPFPRTPKSIEF